jgi:hypothetical protein
MVDKMDGLAPFSAARSCRDINMEHPNTADGTYKLKTRIRMIVIGMFRRL